MENCTHKNLEAVTAPNQDPAYAISKCTDCGMEALTDDWAVEKASYGVDCADVFPLDALVKEPTFTQNPVDPKEEERSCLSELAELYATASIQLPNQQFNESEEAYISRVEEGIKHEKELRDLDSLEPTNYLGEMKRTVLKKACRLDAVAKELHSLRFYASVHGQKLIAKEVDKLHTLVKELKEIAGEE